MACLQTYSEVTYDKDPQPQPPAALLDPVRVERLCREMERVRGTGGESRRAGMDKNQETIQPVQKKHLEHLRDRLLEEWRRKFLGTWHSNFTTHTGFQST